jgi:hypothetical protein
MPVQRRHETHPIDDIDDEDHTPDPDAPSAIHRKQWVGDAEDDRREREIRAAISAGGWPAYVPGPDDPDGEFEEAHPVTENDLITWANLVAKRQSRLDAIILRERLVRWVDLHDTKYREPLDLLADVITVLDEVIENKGGQQPIEGDL